MKKAVLVIAQKNFRDEELFVTRQMLEDSAVAVQVACSSLKSSSGMLGGSCQPDILLSAVKVSGLDALVFIGGAGASQYWDDPLAHQLAREADSSGKVVAAICIAPVTLARAGLLKGKNATVWPGPAEEAELKKAGARFSAKAVEKDGKLITASGPSAAREFAEKIIEAMGE